MRKKQRGAGMSRSVDELCWQEAINDLDGERQGKPASVGEMQRKCPVEYNAARKNVLSLVESIPLLTLAHLDKLGRENAETLKSIIASMKSLCRIELPDSACIDWAIGSVGIEDAIANADAGDQIAKVQMWHLASCHLDNEFNFGPIPSALKSFAARELKKLSESEKHSAPKRPDGGRPLRPYREKLGIAHWLHKRIKPRGTMSQNDACKALANHIDEKCYEDTAVFSSDGFTQDRLLEILVQRKTKKCKDGKNALSPQRIGNLYREMKPHIEVFYGEIKRIRASVPKIRCLD